MNELNNILEYLKMKRGVDFSGSRASMLNRRIQKRIFATNSADLLEYEKHLKQNEIEIDKLIDVLTINVSRFFRNTICYEFISDFVLPSLVRNKIESKAGSLRVWSAGCAAGEEPYSIAILIKEIIEKEKMDLNLIVFATDIDKKILKSAKKGLYGFESIKNMKYRLLEKYFISEGDVFKLKSNIKEMVSFSEFDMLNKISIVPPESIYGSFDIVLCRNLLIYFRPEFQDGIFNKLFRSLSKGGYLFLGEAESLPDEYKNKFIRVNKECKIYKKK